MGREGPQLIKSGVAQADTGQTSIVSVPPNATYGTFYLTVVAVAGTTPLTDFVLYHAPPEITAAVSVSTSTPGLQNETQTLNLTAGNNTDTFKLTFNAHESTAAVTIGAGTYTAVTAAEIKTCLLTISDWTTKTADIAVVKTLNAYAITFTGTLGASDIGAISVTSPVGAAAGSVTETTKGAAGPNEVQTVTLTGGPTFGTWTYAWTGVASNVTVSLPGLSYNEPASGVQAALNAALPYGSTYNGSHIVVTRAGTGTSGDPYIYTFTYSGSTVSSRNVDAATVDGTQLGTYTTDTAIALGNNWSGITQIAGTAAGSVVVTVGPGVTGIADDLVGPNYFLNCPLPSKIAAKVLFDRTTGNEVYTYSLYADWA